MKIALKPLAPMGRDLERGEFLTKSLFITLSLTGRGAESVFSVEYLAVQRRARR